MNRAPGQSTHVAIACGGTGGHLFPGLAVAEELLHRGCSVQLLISPKDVDQQAVRSFRGVGITTLPAVALQEGSRLAFARSLLTVVRRSLADFRAQPPAVVLAMGGFTSVGPVTAARWLRIPAYLHESNTIPGRANRRLARLAREVFVGFPSTASALKRSRTRVTGTPVRAQLRTASAPESRRSLGLDPERPVILVAGGSQGASALNDLVLATLAGARANFPHWQWLHLAGARDVSRVREAHTRQGVAGRVFAFHDHMELVLGAATAAVSRAGASSLAELAACRLPSVLVPYPSAADNHQFHNARAFEATGAAHLLEQLGAAPQGLLSILRSLVEPADVRQRMQRALADWDRPEAATEICDRLMERSVTAASGNGSVTRTTSLERSPSIVA